MVCLVPLDFDRMTRPALMQRCIAANLKRPGVGWQRCGFRGSSPTREEMIVMLRARSAKDAAQEAELTRRRMRRVQEDFHALLVAAHDNQRTFQCKELEDAVIASQLRSYRAYVNLFTGELNPYGAMPFLVPLPYAADAHVAEEKFRASIRSYLFEQSPSSRQYWRKGGVARHPESGQEYQVPSGFVPINKQLAENNAAAQWSDQGGAVRGSHWQVVRVKMGAWDEAVCGPLPTCTQRTQNGARIGWRGAQARVPRPRDPRQEYD